MFGSIESYNAARCFALWTLVMQTTREAVTFSLHVKRGKSNISDLIRRLPERERKTAIHPNRIAADQKLDNNLSPFSFSRSPWKLH